MTLKQINSSSWAVLGAALFYAWVLLIDAPLNALSWDVLGYYLYLPASFIYHDIGLQNQEWLDQINSIYHNTETWYQLVPTTEGKQAIKYPIGWSLLNLPFFFIGHMWALITDYPADGFSKPYQYSIILGNYLYVFLGFVYIRKLLLKWFSDSTVAITILLIAYSTNLFHQLWHATGMVHTYLFGVYAVWMWVLYRDHQNKKPTILLGVLSGLLLATRNSEVIIAPVLVYIFGIWDSTSSNKIKGFWSIWGQFKWGVLIGFGVQIIYWQYISGFPIMYSYQNAGEGFDLLTPHTFDFLLSYRKGWLLYTPVMLIAIAGFFMKKPYTSKWNRALAFHTILNIFLLSSWTTWWFAASFGQRSMVQSYALLAIPLANGVHFIIKSRFKVVGYMVFAAFVILNLFQTWQYEIGVIDPSRMTKDAYWSHFTRLEPLDEKAEELLLIKRSENDLDLFPEFADLNQTKTFQIDFESDSAIARNKTVKHQVAEFFGKTFEPRLPNKTSDFAHSGKYGFILDSTVPISPAIEVSFTGLTTNYYCWIETSAWFMNPEETSTNISFVVTFKHNGSNYKYRTVNVDKPLIAGEWQQVSLKYLTPEIRSNADVLSVYVWNRGESKVLVDDLQVTVYENLK